jgi:hypothetical protein
VSGLFAYSNPRLIHWGPGSVSALGEELARLQAHRVALVTTRSLVAEERLISVVQSSFGDARVAMTAVVSQHAPMAQVEAAIRAAGDARVDSVVSFGGGSPIDAAKMLAVRLADRAGHAPRDEKRDELVHALNESRLRPESPQLAPDPPGQQHVEERPVERTRAPRRRQVKALVLRRPALGCSREHSMVDDGCDRGPFPLLRTVEWQTESLS